MNNTEELKKFISKIANRLVEEEEELLDSGILDSFSFVEIVEFIEQDLGVQIDFKKIGKDKFKTINEIAKTLEEMQRNV